MARTAAYNDTTMPIADTFGEMWASSPAYALIGGCAVTLDAADLTYDVAAGAFIHNGTPVAVSAQANAGTLVADSTNPRWTWIVLDSSGVEAMVSGTAAATPSIPELGADTFPLMLVYVAAGATIASSQTSYDQRVGPTLTQTWRSTSNFTKNTNDTLGDVTGIKFFVGASEVWSFEYISRLSTGATPDIKVAFTVPSGAAVTGTAIKLDAAAPVVVDVADFTASTALASAAAGVGIRLTGTVVNSSTAGWVQLQAAQNTSDASDTILYAQGFITAHRTL